MHPFIYNFTLFEPRHEEMICEVSDQIRHIPAVQLQKRARGVKFRIKEEEGLY